MKAELTLGPLLFHWPADKIRDFYFRIADEAAVDTVCVGEVVCAKRMPFPVPHLPGIVERLERAGKEVLLSSLALISSERESGLMRDLAGNGGRLTEANEIGVACQLAGRPHAIGPFVNIYNEDALAFFVGRGATRVCLPAELPCPSVVLLAAQRTADLEVQVFGRLPLAISARCFHARAHRRHKDSCQFVCSNDPDGMVVRTLENEPFLAVNGTQTLSYSCANLIGELDPLRRAGVHRFRLSPQSVDMLRVAELFRSVLDGRREPDGATADLAQLMPGIKFSNGFFHAVAGRLFQEARARSAE